MRVESWSTALTMTIMMTKMVGGLVVVAGAGEVVTTLVPRLPGAHSGPMTDTTETKTTDNPTGATVADQDGAKSLKVRTQVKAGGMVLNHSEAKGLKVRSQVKAGGWSLNHSEAKGLKVRTQVKAGGITWNHSEAGVLRLPIR